MIKTKERIVRAFFMVSQLSAKESKLIQLYDKVKHLPAPDQTFTPDFSTIWRTSGWTFTRLRSLRLRDLHWDLIPTKMPGHTCGGLNDYFLIEPDSGDMFIESEDHLAGWSSIGAAC